MIIFRYGSENPEFMMKRKPGPLPHEKFFTKSFSNLRKKIAFKLSPTNAKGTIFNKITCKTRGFKDKKASFRDMRRCLSARKR